VLAWVLSGLVSLPLVLFGLLYTTDLENYRGPISRHVSAALGREIEFGGPITLEPSLTPRLVIEGLAIANPDWASRPALALVEHFKVKAGLLPLLRGELEIKALEFHGVDLLLEEGPGESNNYSFGRPGRRTVLPAIEHMLLYDARLAWLPYEGIAKSVHLRQVRVRKVPRQPVELELATELKGLPLQLSLRAEPGGDSWPWGPWQTTAELELADASLKLTGTVPEPSQWYRGAYRFELEGKSLGKLEPLLGLDLPAWGGYRLGGDIRFNLDDYLVISDLSGEIADAELAGSMRWELDELETRPGSWQSVLEVGEFELHALAREALWQHSVTFNDKPTRLTLQRVEVRARPGLPLRISAQAAVDDFPLAIDLRAQALAELIQKPDGPWQDLVLDAVGEGVQLSLSGSVARPLELRGFDLDVALNGPGFARLLDQSGDFALAGHFRDQPDRYVLDDISLRVADTKLSGRVAIHQPGEPDLHALLRQLELDITANIPSALFDKPLVVAGHNLDIGMSTVRVSVQPGQPLQLGSEASIEGRPLKLALRGESLERLARNPAGPWRKLKLQGKGEHLSFSVEGDVEQPLAARGVDATIRLEGEDISQLLPLFDLVLPLQGPYSLSGRFKDTVESGVLDDVKINFGSSDIAGRAQFFRVDGRPRIVLDLSSEQLYLMEFLPQAGGSPAEAATPRVIPDVRLPLERIRQIDAELRFNGRQLRTAVGDLGEVSFALSLEKEKLSLDQFLVRGWAGARVEASGSIDAAQSPPVIDLQLAARELNYGALLRQAGLAESIAGTLDVSVTIAGNGSSGHELLSTANGSFILVGKQGSFGSRRLDLWASDLVTTMLSPNWHREDVTQLNCVVARIGIDNGVASTDTLLVDTNRITIGASGTVDLQSEQINLVFAPRPKRNSLVSLANPVLVTGTLSAPAVEATVLPRRRLATFGGGVLAGLINPAYLVFTFSQLGSGSSDPCVATVEAAEAAKAEYFKNAR
jgi:AsmA family protein